MTLRPRNPPPPSPPEPPPEPPPAPPPEPPEPPPERSPRPRRPEPDSPPPRLEIGPGERRGTGWRGVLIWVDSIFTTTNRNSGASGVHRGFFLLRQCMRRIGGLCRRWSVRGCHEPLATQWCERRSSDLRRFGSVPGRGSDGFEHRERDLPAGSIVPTVRGLHAESRRVVLQSGGTSRHRPRDRPVLLVGQ